MRERKFYAHSKPGEPPEKWQLLEEHLRNVATLAAEFAKKFDSADWAWNAGWLHDIGKYSQEFQNRLLKENDIDASIETSPGRIDHSTAGAKHAVKSYPILGHLLAYAIAGHHSGLLNGMDIGSCQEARLNKSIHSWEHSLESVSKLFRRVEPAPPNFLRDALAEKDSFSIAFFIRLVFSCLVDADFLDTEAYMNIDRSYLRIRWPDDILKRIEKALMHYVDRLNKKDSFINRQRRLVREACLNAATLKSGFFSLTVPTGGGKTLSSLAFAIKHAIQYGMERIIYVIPLTSIIEQNADVFREALKSVSGKLGFDVVLEHHSNFDPEKETAQNRLASENWDAPLIVTTSVQFYESLFSKKTSRCRKLHRMAHSVIILDEAQTLPVDYLKPCLRALKELVDNYRSSIVICTATQPAIEYGDDFKIGISNIREIVPGPRDLYERFNRVQVEDIGDQNDVELKNRILIEKKVLCIVNTKSHARKLFKTLGEGEVNYHLSGNMCPVHRSEKLKQIRKRLKEDRECRVISTQVIEAGVDIDFPVVLRSLAGLDSIAQAAGRCNREGKLGEKGRTYIFRSEHRVSERFFSDTAQCAGQIMSLFKDPLALDAIQNYFKLYYWDQNERWDHKGILDNFILVNDRDFPFNFGFSKTAEVFQLIDDADTCPVIVPWGKEGCRLCNRLRDMATPDLDYRRKLQRYVVGVPRRIWGMHAEKDIQVVHDGIYILASPELHYSKDTGLNFDTDGPGAIFA